MREAVNVRDGSNKHLNANEKVLKIRDLIRVLSYKFSIYSPAAWMPD